MWFRGEGAFHPLLFFISEIGNFLPPLPQNFSDPTSHIFVSIHPMILNKAIKKENMFTIAELPSPIMLVY